MNRSIGMIVKAARRRAGLVLVELGEKVGMSTSTLSDLETGKLKNPLPPSELVRISDALLDRQMLVEYCGTCPVRSRIVIRKFTPLNNIVPGAIPAMLKTTQKISTVAEALHNMMTRLCDLSFRADPDFREHRNEFILKVFEAKNALEIVLDQSAHECLVSNEELLVLMEMHRANNVRKGHHTEEQG
jgi:transcriptional regulator with XRE-family HTH domain